LNADDALNELMEISTQTRRALVVDADGTIKGDVGSGGYGTDAADLLRAADEAARLLGRPPITQCEVGVEGAAVYAVRDDAGRAAIAVTAPDATAGLVFYDLRQVLREIAQSEED
jgi:predicted regulator of Ras-like GTPase activity (Roadblock/LC7/MglB family)